MATERGVGLKAAGKVPDTALLPRDPATGEALPPKQQPGYYPGYSTMAQKAFWDEATRALVVKRVEKPPAVRYFSPGQARFWAQVFEHLLPQTDRVEERRIPLVAWVDDRLYRNQGVGYRYANMPPDREAYRLGEEAIDAEARHRFGGEFVMLPQASQERVLEALHDLKQEAAEEIWARMSKGRFWQLMMQDVLEAYYAHPWAWDEIGFGGPAYPRAYTRLERGEPEPWEVRAVRYEWEAPGYAVSDESEATEHLHLESEQNRHES